MSNPDQINLCFEALMAFQNGKPQWVNIVEQHTAILKSPSSQENEKKESLCTLHSIIIKFSNLRDAPTCASPCQLALIQAWVMIVSADISTVEIGQYGEFWFPLIFSDKMKRMTFHDLQSDIEVGDTRKMACDVIFEECKAWMGNHGRAGITYLAMGLLHNIRVIDAIPENLVDISRRIADFGREFDAWGIFQRLSDRIMEATVF